MTTTDLPSNVIVPPFKVNELGDGFVFQNPCQIVELKVNASNNRPTDPLSSILAEVLDHGFRDLFNIIADYAKPSVTITLYLNGVPTHITDTKAIEGSMIYLSCSKTLDVLTTDVAKLHIQTDDTVTPFETTISAGLSII